jgi:AcrR family transcriptional regulator
VISPKKNFQKIRYKGKKSSILESAARIFSKKGFEKATLEEIASELHLTKGSLYYYIKSKEDMLFQCHMKALKMANECLMKIQRSGLDPELKFRKAIIGHTKVLTEAFVIGTLRQQEMLLPKRMRDKVIVERDKFEKTFLQMMSNGMKKEIFEKKNGKMKAYAILGALNWIPRWYSPEGKLTPEEIGEAMASYLIGGLLKQDQMPKADAVR